MDCWHNFPGSWKLEQSFVPKTESNQSWNISWDIWSFKSCNPAAESNHLPFCFCSKATSVHTWYEGLCPWIRTCWLNNTTSLCLLVTSYFLVSLDWMSRTRRQWYFFWAALSLQQSLLIIFFYPFLTVPPFKGLPSFNFCITINVPNQICKASLSWIVGSEMFLSKCAPLPYLLLPSTNILYSSYNAKF